ncbi:MAG: class I SAM-dependent RNA methyltransferase, partial [Fibrobacter sp.]|nr:class I SAM-dependent RNA methyltransferase [Fibrobacter sp.]
IHGTFSDAMFLNLHLRTAHHVLFQINEFQCDGPDKLYKEIHRMPWETMILSDGYLSVDSNVSHPSIRDSRFANMKAKDAIVDRIQIRKGRRPDSGPEKKGAVVHLYWKDDKCTVYIDTSGEPLSKRGYRKNPYQAPMQETLAAAVIMAGRWKPSEQFINPMCGSGTLAIEAALIGLNRAPGLLREYFSFKHTLFFNRQIWDEMRAQAKAREVKNTMKIFASDVNPEALDAAKKNAETAGISSFIEFTLNDFEQTVIPPGGGVIIINPEYGMRMGEESALEDTYRRIGNFFKNKCQGYRGYVFTGNTTLAGKIGLKSGRKIPFQSGKIECRLYEYELYRGTKNG